MIADEEVDMSAQHAVIAQGQEGVAESRHLAQTELAAMIAGEGSMPRTAEAEGRGEEGSVLAAMRWLFVK